MGDFKVIQTEGDVLNRFYKFIIWDVKEQSSVKVFGEGEWADWGHFKAQVRKYSDLFNKSAQQGNEPPKDISYATMVNLSSVSMIEPQFVSDVRKRNARREKGSVHYFLASFYEDYVAPAFLRVFVLVVFGAMGWGLWSGGKRLLGGLGVIEYKYETKGDRRYKTFLNTVKGCQLKDTVTSPEKTDNWPRYAVYACPDGSRKTWRYKVKVITESKGKLIVE